MHGRFVARDVGPATIGVLVLAAAVLWVVARPAGEPTARYVGQLLGAESILLLSIGLVLISTLPWVEEWFDGIDKAAIWHRRVAITGLALLAPHVLLSSNPRAPGALPLAAPLPGGHRRRDRGRSGRSRDAPDPPGRRLRARQFAMVYLEAKDGWHRHPFAISSAPHEDVVRVTVKALGDYTSRLRELIEPGMP